MSREILFRGFNSIRGKTFMGMPVIMENGLNGLVTIDNEFVVVDEWQQYTNIDDKHGEKIFEGDGVRYEFLTESKVFEGIVEMQRGEWMIVNGLDFISLFFLEGKVEIIK